MQPVALKILTNTLRRKHEEKSRSIIDGNYDGGHSALQDAEAAKRQQVTRQPRQKKKRIQNPIKMRTKKPQIRLQH